MHPSCLFFVASFFFILSLRMSHGSDQCLSEELVYGKATQARLNACITATIKSDARAITT